MATRRKTRNTFRSRWLQFSLRGLLLLFVVCALLLGWATSRYRAACRQQALVANGKATVLFGDPDDEATWKESAPGAPPWLRRVCGDTADELFRTAVAVQCDGEYLAEVLPLVRDVATIRDIDITGWLPDASIYEPLYGLDQVERLCFECNTYDWNLRHIDRMSQLRVLRLLNWEYSRRHPFSDKCIPSIVKLRNLETLSIINSEITDEGLGSLACLPKLRELNIGSNQISGSGLEAFAGRESLEKLILRSPARLEPIGRLPGLRVLRIGAFDVPQESYESIGTLPRLEELYLRSARIDNEGLRRLASLDELRRLELPLTRIGGEALKYLRGLRNLQELDVSDTKVGDESMPHVLALRSLRSLNLGGTPLTDRGLVELATATQLEFLNLRGTQVTAAGLEYLNGMDGLRAMNLPDRLQGAAELAKLKKALPKCSIRP